MGLHRSLNDGETESASSIFLCGEKGLEQPLPLPGREPGDISTEVTTDALLVVSVQLWGPQKGVNEIILDEWVPGNYHRELALPQAVDGAAANVTYGNGVVVVVLPLSDVTTAAQLQMTPLAHDHGMRIGNAGHFGQFSGSDAADVGAFDDVDATDADDILAEEDDILIEDIDASQYAKDAESDNAALG